MSVFKSSTVVFTYHIYSILSLLLLYLYIYSQYQVHIVLTEST